MSEPGPSAIAGFVADSPDIEDVLDVERSVRAIAALITSRHTSPPLCVGIFGPEGSGVSYFLRRVASWAEELSSNAARAKDSAYSSALQISYNPWHYVGTNQWLALAERVFQALQDSMPRDSASRDARTRLLERVGTAGKRGQELEAKAHAADRVAAIAQQTLEKAQHEHDRALETYALQVSESRWTAINALFADRVGADGSGAGIDRAGGILGLSRLSQNAEALHKVNEEAKTFGGRASLLNSIITAQRHVGNVLLSIAVSLLVAGVSWVLLKLYSGPADVAAWIETVKNALGVIATVGTFFIVVAALLLRNRAAAAIDSLQPCQRTLELAIGEVDRQRRFEELVANQRERVLQKQVEEASVRVAEASRNLALAEQAIVDEEIAGVHRGVAETYRDLISTRQEVRPAIVPLIREDFAALSRLLTESGWEGAPQGPERIIIYIDDLDQCPAETVAEVIQAIQLLLSFPIFVVVVGANPAWLLAALEARYAGLPAAWPDASEGAPATPAARSVHALSKFIHVPFWMPRLTGAGARRLAKSMLGPNTKLQREPAVAEPAPAPVVSAEPESRPPLVDPEAAMLTTAETDFLEQAASVLDSARDVKRLVNSYRILRSTLTDRALHSLTGSFAAYAAAITQLAVLIAAPFSARRYAELLMGPVDSPDELVKALAADEGLGPEERDKIEALIEIYGQRSAGGNDLAALREWLGAAARHSLTLPPSLVPDAAHRQS